jgi:hypothetical protein
VDEAKDIQYASLWITACILIHTFAMDHEGTTDNTANSIGTVGVDNMADDAAQVMQEAAGDILLAAEREWLQNEANIRENEREAQAESGLVAGKERREQLKIALLQKIRN